MKFRTHFNLSFILSYLDRQWISHALILILTTYLLSACKETSLQLDSVQSSASVGKSDFLPNAIYRVFEVRSDGSQHMVSELLAKGGSIVIPNSLVNGSFGKRLDPNQGSALNLYLKVYSLDGFGKNGDIYYETPILTSQIDLNSSVTALSLQLRLFHRQDLVISQNSFQNLLKNMDLNCSECSKMKTTDVLSWMRASIDFQARLESILLSENPSLVKGSLSWDKEDPMVIYSSFPLEGTSSANIQLQEGDTSKVRLVFFDFSDSARRLFPESWIHQKEGVTVESSTVQEFVFSPSYMDSGNHTILAAKSSSTGATIQYQFPLTVSNVNQAPSWFNTTDLSFQANHNKKYSLLSKASDPDSNSISFSLVRGPSGLVVSSSGDLEWNPMQSPDAIDQTGDSDVVVAATDNDGQSTSVTLKMHVTQDHLPRIAVLGNPWIVQEGTQAQMTVEVIDDDGDLPWIEFEGVENVQTMNPSTAGWMNLGTNITLDQPGRRRFVLSFLPSFSQTLGRDGTLDITLKLNYDPMAADLRRLSNPSAEVLHIQVQNVDDPPEWQGDISDLSAVEGDVIWDLATSSAIDQLPVPGGSVTYSLDTNTSISKCDWGVVTSPPASFGDAQTGGNFIYIHPTNAHISAKIPYYSSAQCGFRLVATDASGNISYSNTFIISVTNVNRPPVIKAAAPTTLVVNERDVVTLRASDYFEDPDVTDGDVTDLLSLRCLNCSSFNLSMSPSSGQLSWIVEPFAADNGPYNLQFEGYDRSEQVTATHTVAVTVNQVTAPAIVTTTLIGNSLEISEGASQLIQVDVSAFSGLSVDQFTYSLNLVNCSPSCRSGFISLVNRSNWGDGDLRMNGGDTSSPQSFYFSVSPNTTDGDASLPSNGKTYALKFQVVSDSDPTLTTDLDVALKIINVNRPPKKLYYGIQSSVLNSDATRYTMSLNLNADVKQGSTWKNTNTLYMKVEDDDGMNDIYTPGFINIGSRNPPSDLPSTIQSGVVGKWEFKLPSCINKLTGGTVSRIFSISISDGRGGTIKRDVEIKISNASASTSCM